MNRTVPVAGIDWEVPSLGQRMDDAFDRMYSVFSRGEALSIDDEFKGAAFEYFDSYVKDTINSPAAHDHYFNFFGRYGAL